jgi:AcrR family transcriptional regulator
MRANARHLRPSRVRSATRELQRSYSAHLQVDHFRRGRMLSAIATAADEHGVDGATVSRVISLAGVSRRTFYESFTGRNDCLLAAIDRAVALAHARALEEWATQQRWLDRVRVTLAALLEFFDREPQLARLCFVHSSSPAPPIVARRLEIVGELASLLDGARASKASGPAALTSEALVGGALSVVQARLLRPKQNGLTELAGPLTSFIALPFYGTSVAGRELQRRSNKAPQRDAPSSTNGFAPRPKLRITYRTVQVLSAIDAEPGLSNRAIGTRAEITDEGQISKLLHRLAGAGMIENFGPGPTLGGANSWRLTAAGRRFVGGSD